MSSTLHSRLRLETESDDPSPVLSPEGRGARGAGGFRLLCPECLGGVVVDREKLVCLPEGKERPIVDGILPLLSEARRRELTPFLDAYQVVRRAEGWGGDASYYLGLPFEDRSGRHAAIWRLRARSFRELVSRLPKESARVMELGAGNCWCASRLAALGHEVLATDVHRDGEDGLGALDLYASKLSCVPARAEAEMTRLPLEDAQFDAVVANGSFHYASDLGLAVREACRVLRGGGRLLVLDSPTYARREEGEAMVAEREREHSGRYGLGPTPGARAEFLVWDDFERLLESAGFEVEITRPFQGIDRTLRRIWTEVRGHREPADFPVWTAQKAALSPSGVGAAVSSVRRGWGPVAGRE